MCWGNNSGGQIGDNTSGTKRLAPTQVSGLASDVTAITAGAAHTCALTSGGGVLCWGDNAFGQIGDNTRGTDRLVPTQVVGLTSDVHAITASETHTCALTAAGAIMCWGDGSAGQIGDGTWGPEKLVPTRIANVAGFYHVPEDWDCEGTR